MDSAGALRIVAWIVILGQGHPFREKEYGLDGIIEVGKYGVKPEIPILMMQKIARGGWADTGSR
jgi:hypothetical protein